MEDDWLRTVLLGASPDLLNNEVPVHRAHIVHARNGRELDDIALLVSERHTGTEASDRTEVVHGTDAEGVPLPGRRCCGRRAGPPCGLPTGCRTPIGSTRPVLRQRLLDDTTNPLSGVAFTIPIAVPDGPGQASADQSRDVVDGYARRLLALLRAAER
ncbi:hypothetical protein OHA35_39305 [Streptomyces sp. NBC_00233]|nr:hypothetical protein [Streptomyces sp. NBC_00233]